MKKLTTLISILLIASMSMAQIAMNKFNLVKSGNHQALCAVADSMPFPINNCNKQNGDQYATNPTYGDIGIGATCGVTDTSFAWKLMQVDTLWTYFQIRAKSDSFDVAYEFQQLGYQNQIEVEYFNGSNFVWTYMDTIDTIPTTKFLPMWMRTTDGGGFTSVSIVRYKRTVFPPTPITSGIQVDKSAYKLTKYTSESVYRFTFDQNINGTYQVIDGLGRVLKTSSFKGGEVTVNRSIAKGMVYVIFTSSEIQTVEKIIL
jgi:hypothetical protein